MRKITAALIGAGARGQYAYGNYALNHKDSIEFIAVAEPNETRRSQFATKHNISNEMMFSTWEQLLGKEKLADAILICNNDESHYEPTKIALEKGYNVLLEKPMSNNLEEVIRLGELAKAYPNQVFMICHVLRYTTFFEELKKIVDSKELGELVSIQHNENIGYWHFAHSFTRGNWRNSDETSPLILAKSCHDMDILLWLVNSTCNKIASFGSLSHFNADNFNSDKMDKRCLSCAEEEECPYSAKKLYLGERPIFASVVHPEPTKENLIKALLEGPYGRCVYQCDNNVVDHMVTILEFDNKVTATFNLSAFTKDIHRTIKLMFTHGEVGANDHENIIEIKKFGEVESKIIHPHEVEGGHGGGDTGIMNDFVNCVANEIYNTRTSALKSVESHIMAFAAEHSRINSCVVHVNEYLNKNIEQLEVLV